jgi:dipeptidyl aminopeptidase/acylaminoacyl peptidase
VVPADGGAPLLPTEELDRSVQNVQWSLDGQRVLFVFEDDRDRMIGSVPFAGGEIDRRKVGDPSLERGIIRSFEVGQRGVAVLASSPHRPTEIYRLSDGLALSDHNRALREEISWGAVRGSEATGEDGVRIGSMLTFPPNHQPGTPLPTIAYIHGGPVGQDGFEFDSTAQLFAAAGYLVVQPNYRGSSGRGSDFTRAIFAKWGSFEIQDIHTAVDHLVAEGLADPKRLGIGGWSYGGINTNYAIATDTRFSAAVSGSGIANLLTGYGTDQYTWQYETEIGKPWDPDALARYLELSYPFLHADRIKTPTMFMCGEKDFNVPLINSEQMYQALVSLGVPTQLVIYPGQYHGLSVPSYLQDRMERMIAWYDEYLTVE